MQHNKVLLIISLLIGLTLGQSDTVAPSITLASTVTEINSPNTIFLAAVASDLGGIAKVEFYKSGSKLSEDSEAPYSVGVSLDASDAGSVSFEAIAYDNSGNSQRSNTITVLVNIGTAPAVSTPETTTPATPETPEPTTNNAQTGPLQAMNDSYMALVNTLLVVGPVSNSGMASTTAEPSLLANDVGITGSSVVISETLQSMLGGEVAIYTDGSFSYKPPLNVMATEDSFDYTVTDGQNSSSATVTIQINAANQSGKVIYVSATAANGNGHAASPFTQLSEAEAVSEPGDVIVVQTGSYASLNDHQISLKNGQHLLGQGKPVVIAGQTVLPASNPPVLLRSGGSSLILANDVVVSGLSISRANATGNATADTGAGSGSSGIIIPKGLNGTILIEDVSIRHVGGFGILVQSDGSSSNRLSSLTLNNVSVDSPGLFAIAVDDVMNLVVNGGQISNLRNNPNEGGSGRGLAIEAGYDSNISISGLSVSSIGDRTAAIYLTKNTASGESSSMTVSLNNNSLTFPEAGAEASAAITISYNENSAGSLTLEGQGNSTNSISPFFLAGSGAGTNLSGSV